MIFNLNATTKPERLLNTLKRPETIVKKSERLILVRRIYLNPQSTLFTMLSGDLCGKLVKGQMALLQMHKDPVANIRINVAKTIQALAAPLKATKENQVRKKLLNFCVGCCASDT